MTSVPDPRALAAANADHSAPPFLASPPAGLEAECLRQAIHDLRGSLNTSSVLLDLVVALSSRDPAMASAKAHMVVRELQSTARMLDLLVGTSDSLASELVPVDLAAAIIAVSHSSPPAPRGVVVDADAERLRSPCWIRSCPKRLSRALTLVVEKCGAALPDGGSIHFEPPHSEPPRSETTRSENRGDAGRVRLVVAARGKRVLGPPEGRLHLFASKDAAGKEPAASWFPVLALVRGIGGDVHVQREDGTGLRLVLDFPRGSSGQP
jgi:hypothetical protein